MSVEYTPEELEQMYQHYLKRLYAGASYIRRSGLPELTSTLLQRNGIGKQIQSDLMFDGILTLLSIRADVNTYAVNETALNSFLGSIPERGNYIDGQQTLGVVL